MRQYEGLIEYLWRVFLDPENKGEVNEQKFFIFMRNHKLITEKKQLDEMYRQCLFYKKGEEISVGATVSFTLY